MQQKQFVKVVQLHQLLFNKDNKITIKNIFIKFMNHTLYILVNVMEILHYLKMILEIFLFKMVNVLNIIMVLSYN